MSNKLDEIFGICTENFTESAYLVSETVSVHKRPTRRHRSYHEERLKGVGADVRNLIVLIH